MKAALRKYEDFKATCGDLLDPSENTLVAVAAAGVAVAAAGVVAWLSRNVYFLCRFGR